MLYSIDPPVVSGAYNQNWVQLINKRANGVRIEIKLNNLILGIILAK